MWIAPSNLTGAPRSPRYFIAAYPIAADAKLAAELAAGSARDHSLAIENLGTAAVLADALPRLEVLGGARRDIAAVGENTTRQLGDSNFPDENTASSGSDTQALLEWLATERSDGNALIENLGQAAIFSNNPAWLEWIATRRLDTGLPAESSGVLALFGDAVLRLELLSRAQNDGKTSAENVASTIHDTKIAEESTTGIVRDAFVFLEWLAWRRTDYNAPTEEVWQATVAANAAAWLEFVGTASADQPIPVESLRRAVRDVAAQIESLFTASTPRGVNYSVPIELTAWLYADSGEPAAWLLSVSITGDSEAPIEIDNRKQRPPPQPPQISGIVVRLLRG